MWRVEARGNQGSGGCYSNALMPMVLKGVVVHILLTIKLVKHHFLGRIAVTLRAGGD